MGPAPTDAELAAAALDYPFGRAEGSFALGAGAPARPAGSDEIAAAAGGRVALLAYGANASPARLALKLASLAGEWVVVVATAWLRGFDVVYSAHVSPHGAISATLHPAPGTAVAVHVALLTAKELERVHRTEPNYAFGRLDGIDARVEGLGRVEELHAYVSRHGALAHVGRPVALVDVGARGRELDALDEPGLMAAVRDRLAPGADLDAFVAAAVRDPDIRAGRTASLHEGAVAFAHAGWVATEPC